MAENRYHELLGLPEEVEEPDYYQILDLERGKLNGEDIEPRFKEQMTKLQRLDNPRHKEFIEFLKGELKRARSILTDPGRRKEYDRELTEERSDDLREILSHMLVDGTLSSQAELSVISEGRNLGLEGVDIRAVIDEEIRKTGAKRVSSKAASQSEHKTVIIRAQEFAKQVQDARMGARLANARARMAELQQKKAQENADVAQHKAKQAQAQIRRAINRESVAAAMGAMSEQERQVIQARLDQNTAKFNEAARQIHALRAKLKEKESDPGPALRARRLMVVYALVFIAFVGVQAVRVHAPPTVKLVEGLLSRLQGIAGADMGTTVPIAALGVFLVLSHLTAGIRKPLFVLPLVASFVAAVALALGS